MSWYYLKDGAQFGPVSQEELKGLFKEKTVKSEDLVWKDGMSDWKRAGEVLVSPVAAPIAPQVAEPAPSIGNEIYAPPGASEVTSRGDGSLAGVEIKRASFPLLLSLGIISFVIIMAGGVLFGIGEENLDNTLITIGGVVIAVAVILYIILIVLTLKYLYRCWLIVNTATGGYVKATPGQAVGFLFIPFFNLYWVYVAYYGWSQEYNKISAQHGWNNQVPEGIFLTNCILQSCALIPLVNYIVGLGQLVIGPIMIYHMCRTINHHANA